MNVLNNALILQLMLMAPQFALAELAGPVSSRTTVNKSNRYRHPWLRPSQPMRFTELQSPLRSSTTRRRTLPNTNTLRPFAFANQPSAVHDASLWLLRSLSAISTYFGFVVYSDRPRGRLLVNEDSIQVKASQVAGLGLFATTRLSQGLVLGTYPGVVISLQQNLGKLAARPNCEGYVWRFADNQYIIDPTNSQGLLDEYCVGGNHGQFGSVFVFERLLRFSVSTALCRINEPPIGKDVNVATIEDLKRRQVVFQVQRDIAAGEELFIDYGLAYDRSRYGYR
jgi:hypothetical protein